MLVRKTLKAQLAVGTERLSPRKAPRLSILGRHVEGIRSKKRCRMLLQSAGFSRRFRCTWPQAAVVFETPTKSPPARACCQLRSVAAAPRGVVGAKKRAPGTVGAEAVRQLGPLTRSSGAGTCLRGFAGQRHPPLLPRRPRRRLCEWRTVRPRRRLAACEFAARTHADFAHSSLPSECLPAGGDPQFPRR